MSPALAGRFSTTAPPGKPNSQILEPHLQNFECVSSGVGPRICISNKFLGDADAEAALVKRFLTLAVQWNHLLIPKLVMFGSHTKGF